ncbi:hypothetical protein [uncultured Bacteroides sp.]|uniref:hypothetical protein n=1 Tax=uncultured Bacteroides sp. TaxID=162156 RepID=UPI0023D79FB8|nr:hypothetical protein [uncultured Bacteroides sp.]MDE5702282.1 hypothetical protein [Bacteroides sp.]
MVSIEKTPELQEYENWLQKLAVKKLNTPVFNEGREHAAILLKTIFEHANEYVYIYCCCLRDELTGIGDYYEALKSYIQKGKTIRVLLNGTKSEIDERRSIFQLIGSDNYKILTKEQREQIEKKLNKQNVHFTLADDCVYRMEYDIEHFKALASFNDRNVGAVLKNAFESVWK